MQVNLPKAFMARSVIYKYLNRTNLTHYPELSRLIGCEAFVKHENHNPTGSFKIRGALNFFHHMSREELEAGILVATRGNHGLAMAWAGQWFNVPCTVVVPEHNNPEINRTIESYGAELIVHGDDFYDAQSYCEELVDSAGYYYVQQGNEPEILNGLATIGLEIMEDLAGSRYYHLSYWRRCRLRVAFKNNACTQTGNRDNWRRSSECRILL